MTDAADAEKTTHGRHLSATVKFILAAGAVATALGAIIGLGQLLWPDPPTAPERMSAKISGVQVDPDVPLAEYLENTPQAPPDQTASVSRTMFAGASAAAASPPAVVSGSGAESEPGSKSSPDEQSETESPVTTPQPPPTVTTPPPSPPPVGPPPERPKVVREMLDLVEQKPVDDIVFITPDEEPATATMEHMRLIVTAERDAPPAEVRKVLASSRLQIANTGDTSKLSPIGVVVNFSAQIDGFQGKRSIVRWSLFDARQRTRMPQPWLRNRQALRLIPESGSDRGSPSVWVPLPRERGPYFVRLELFDDRGTRLTMADTKSFDR